MMKESDCSYEGVRRLRRQILTVSHKGRDGNLQSTFSSLDLIYVLYNYVLNCGPDNASDPDRDYFILSKGQATLGLLTVLADRKFFPAEELDSFCQLNSRISMQADRTKFNGGIEISAGSLGHGFPQAVGVAIAGKIQKSPSRVFTLCGDGEFNEGTMWEAAAMAGYRKLDNLCVIIDDNHSVGAMIDLGDLAEKLRAFGFMTVNINGHDHREIREALSMSHPGKPLAVIAETIRGYGSETMMKENKWFHRFPDEEELDLLLKEIDCFETGNVQDC